MDYYNHTLVPLDNNPLITQSDHIKYPINLFPVQCLGKFDDIRAFEEFNSFLEPLDKVLEKISEFMGKQSKSMEEPLEIILDLGALTCD